MDKNIIKSYLKETFLSEEATPGIKVTDAVKKESGKINKAGVKDVAKDSLDYNKSLKQDKDTSKMANNKYNYTNDAEKTYHDEMETMNGQEMIKYDSEPGKEFSQRAQESIEGSTRMGNKGGKGVGNAEESWGASSDDFGKNLTKRVKDSERKRAIADAPIDSLTSLGDKIAYPNDKVSVTPDKTAMSGGKGKNDKGDKTPQTKSVKTSSGVKSVKEGTMIPMAEKNMNVNELTKGLVNKVRDAAIDKRNDTIDIDPFTSNRLSVGIRNLGQYINPEIKAYIERLGGRLSDGNAGEIIMAFPTGGGAGSDVYVSVSSTKAEVKNGRISELSEKLQTILPKIIKRLQGDLNSQEKAPNELKENNKSQIKESMKRLKFKKEFNGVGNALKLIPEAYRTDKKEFEMTDGNETYRIRWEGTLTEGRAVVITASDKKMVNEDMAHMKHLMGYKSQETLGLLKGNARIDENKSFGDIWNKTKILLEGGDIESAKAKEGDLDKVKKQAPEAKKHIEGSVSKDKGTKAPAAKEGDLDDAVDQAPEAKKHVEGSVSTEKGTKAPAPKKGEWGEVKKKAKEATKHVTMKESFEAEEDEDETAPHEAGEKEEHSEMTTETSVKGTVAPAPKKGHWEDINVPQAPEAKKHIHLKENEEIEGDDDSYYKGDDDDSSSLDAEPKAGEISNEVPAIDSSVPAPAPKGTSTILYSPSTGEYWLKVGDATTKVPQQYLSIASDKSMKAYQRAEKIVNAMQDDADNDVNYDIEDEEGEDL